MDERAFYRRQFLNSEEHGGGAFVEASISEVRERHLDATFTIADCSRVIDLDFGCYNTGAENALLKVRRLLSVLKGFERALQEQLEIYRANGGT